MALHTDAIAYDDFTGVDSVQRMALGTYVHAGQKTYVYVQGVSSGAAGKWVTFTSAGVTTLLAGNATGNVGILMGALDATTDYGFAQVFGINTIASSDTIAAGDVAIYIDGTVGRVDDADAAQDMVINALALTADTSNVVTVWINYPFVIDVAIN